MNIKVLILTYSVNETRYLVEHVLCECKCRFNENVCDSKQELSHYKCRCDCNKSITLSSCKICFIWNPITCSFGCDKMWEIGEYLNIRNSICKETSI